MQESCLRACRTLDNFVPGTNAKAWLFRILISVAANDRRRRRRQRVVPLEDAEPHFDHAALQAWRSGTDGARVLESTTALENALVCLPEEFRATVLLVDVAGLTYEEASRALDCPVGTVRSRLSRARRALLAILNEGRIGTGCPFRAEE